MTPRHRALTRDSRALCAAVLFSTLVLASAARAEPVRAVVELFTSQGCGACRTADPVLRDLSRQPGVIALAVEVDHQSRHGAEDRGCVETRRQCAGERAGADIDTDVLLELLQGQIRAGQVRWVDQGRAGICFRDDAG